MLIGIDLGTTNSVCAVYRDGQPHIIPNNFSEELTPSCVSFEKHGALHVGKTARTRAALHPEQSVAHFKRYMGTEKTYTIHGQTYTPVELSSLVLKNLVEDAERHTGERVTEAVISVPAYFNGVQRKATLQAAEMIDLKVEKLINEPTAAAIAYGLQNKPEYTDFMIIDLGGGTFDVSIMEYFDDILEVKASGGDNFLGGEDFLKVLVELYCEQAGVNLNKLNNKDKQLLFARMEELKKQGSKSTWQVNPFMDAVSETIEIDPAAFERACKPLLQKMIKSIELCLKDARLSPDEIDEIILVGGASRTSFVRSMVTRLFRKMPRTDINPDLTIAYGAAIQAGLKARNEDLRDVVLTDVCPYTLGTGIVGESIYDDSLLFSPIIERNTVVPASRVNIYETAGDDQTRIHMEIYQGESRLVKNNILLGDFEVKVPKGPKGREKVALRISYDVNGILEVDAEVLSTGEKTNLLINNSPQELSDQDIARSRKKLSALKFHPRESEVVKELLLRAESIYENSIAEEREAINQLLAWFNAILETQDPDRIKPAIIEMREQLESFEANRWF
jgi:molecular chaperone HscC